MKIRFLKLCVRTPAVQSALKKHGHPARSPRLLFGARFVCVLNAELLMLRAPVGLQICGVARAGQLRGHGRDRTSGRANQNAGLWIFCSRGRRFLYLKAEYLFSKGPPQKGDSLGVGTGGIGAEGGGRRAARDTFLSPQDRVIAVAAGGNTHEEVRMELSSIKVAVTVTLDAVFRLTVTVPPVLLSTVTGYAPLPEGPPEPLCAGAVSRQVSPFVWDREIRDADGPEKGGRSAGRCKCPFAFYWPGRLFAQAQKRIKKGERGSSGSPLPLFLPPGTADICFSDTVKTGQAETIPLPARPPRKIQRWIVPRLSIRLPGRPGPPAAWPLSFCS